MSENEHDNKLEINSVNSDKRQTLSTKNPSEKNSLLKVDDISAHDIEKDILVTSDMSFNQERRRIGYTYAFRYRNGEPRIIIGPHWPFLMCLSSFIISICFLYFYALWDILSDYVKFIGVVLLATQIASYWYTALINPGIPKKEMWLNNGKEINIKNSRVCYICNVVMNLDEGTEHCDDCGVCIEGHDHHCPWTSKCIGKGNIRAFYIFVSFTFVLIGFLIFGLTTTVAAN